MLKISPFGRSLLAALLMTGGAAWPAFFAHADSNGGYAGLIAPASNTPDGTQSNGAEEIAAPADSGYAGLIAGPVSAGASEQTPAPQPQQDIAQQQRAQQPQTAHLPPSPFDQPEQRRTPQYTGVAVASVIGNAPPVQTLKANFSGLSPGTIGGMPAMEYTTEKVIKQSISTINDTHLSTAQRLKNARKAYQYLSSLAAGLRIKQDIPDSIYKNMGLSDAYIHAERTSNNASLVALNTALRSLKPYQ